MKNNIRGEKEKKSIFKKVESLIRCVETYKNGSIKYPWSCAILHMLEKPLLLLLLFETDLKSSLLTQHSINISLLSYGCW